MKKRFKVEIDILKRDQERQLKDHKEMLDIQQAEHTKVITKLHTKFEQEKTTWMLEKKRDMDKMNIIFAQQLEVKYEEY